MFGDMVKKWAPARAAELYVPRADGTYNLIEARRGRGKSYALADIAYHSICRDNVPVIANFRVNIERMALVALFDGYYKRYNDAYWDIAAKLRYATNLDDYLLAYNAVILWDEANRTMDAYGSSRDIPPVLHDWAQQSRKHRLTLWFAVQYIDFIDRRFRMLFDWLYRARVVRSNQRQVVAGVSQRVPVRFNFYGSDPYSNGVGAEIVRRADRKFTIWFSPVRARIYNSWEVIHPPETATAFRTFAQVRAYMESLGIIAPDNRDVQTPDEYFDLAVDL
jgi:hypothetical protein